MSRWKLVIKWLGSVGYTPNIPHFNLQTSWDILVGVGGIFSQEGRLFKRLALLFLVGKLIFMLRNG